jgi:putative sugar O-methyltransferase
METFEYENYCSVCLDAVNNPTTFSNFKNNPTYKTILEHVSPQQGSDYLKLIQQNSLYDKINWKDIIKNDNLGSPITFNYTINDKQYDISPTTLRYVYYGLQILQFLKEIKNTTPNIIEIGGGYGGQCYILTVLSKLFEINISKYVILDLKEVTLLQNKYLQELNTPVDYKCYTLEQIEIIKNANNFVVSNYAFSELDNLTQNQYLDKVINNSTSGYLVWNTQEGYEKFFPNRKIIVETEIPLTGPNNKIVKYIY